MNDAPVAPKLFCSTDFGVLVGLPFLTIPAWFLDDRHWPSLSRHLAPMAISDLTKEPSRTIATIKRTVGRRIGGARAELVLRDMAAEGVLTFLQVLKCHRWGRWEPSTRLMGAENVTRALSRGRGAILWVAHGFHGHLGAKVALHRAGIGVHHLSTPAHGFSSSRFGMRWLNRLQTSIEDRYLAERILLPVSGQNSALNTIVRRLKSNAIVTITGQRGSGRWIAAPIFDGQAQLAPGAPTLAHLTGAALLPTFAFRGQDGVVETRIEEPIELSRSIPRDQAIVEAALQFARATEPHVLQFPGQWLGWVQM